MVQYTDALGQVIDTGSAVQPTTRSNVLGELHLPRETDTGSKLTVVVASADPSAGGIPHFHPQRPQGSVR